MNDSRLSDQADVFSQYLIGRVASPKLRSLYIESIKSSGGEVSPKDTKLINLATNQPWLLGLLDGGLALVQPNSELRRRLYIMFAILEASTEHHDKFLPQKHSPFYFILIGLVGIRSVLKAVFGVVLVKVIF